MNALLLQNVRPLGASPLDIRVRGDRIAEIGVGLPVIDDETVEDGAGSLLLPGLVEGHTHLDKSLWGLPWHVNTATGTFAQKIAAERELRRTLVNTTRNRIDLALAFLSNGTTRLRTHVDVDTEAGLTHLRSLLDVRAAVAGQIEIQIVAFPQSGMLIRPGTVELLSQALAEGADAIGGIDPSLIDRDPAGSIDTIFRLAEKHGSLVDIHVQEPNELGAFALELILDRTEALGFQGRVVASHAFCLGAAATPVREALLDRMARLRVAIATTAPASRPVPAVAACRAHGVTIFGGSDGVRDAWGPYATPDMLHRAMLIALRNDFRRDEELGWALDCVTYQGAKGCGFGDYGLEPGCRADLVLVDAATVADAASTPGPRRLVISSGKIFARNGAVIEKGADTAGDRMR